MKLFVSHFALKWRVIWQTEDGMGEKSARKLLEPNGILDLSL